MAWVHVTEFAAERRYKQHGPYLGIGILQADADQEVSRGLQGRERATPSRLPVPGILRSPFVRRQLPLPDTAMISCDVRLVQDDPPVEGNPPIVLFGAKLTMFCCISPRANPRPRRHGAAGAAGFTSEVNAREDVTPFVEVGQWPQPLQCLCVRILSVWVRQRVGVEVHESRSSSVVMGSEQHGHSPPGPTRRMNLPHSHLCSPSWRVPQSSSGGRGDRTPRLPQIPA